jgi:uracil-DNA glycosylase
MTLEEYFGRWMRVIDKRELESVLSKLGPEYKRKPICPAQSNVFKAFEVCPYDKLKVVMLGQDPYLQKGVATGILFGNKEGTRDEDLSPSLQVIKEAAINFEIPHNCIIFDPTLESWAKQGILMINSALTVEMNKIGSHVMLWRPFIASLLKKLSENETGIIYVLFGKQAQTFKPYINKQFNTVLEENHPAYFARTGEAMPHTVFEQISKLTKGMYGMPITWYQEY